MSSINKPFEIVKYILFGLILLSLLATLLAVANGNSVVLVKSALEILIPGALLITVLKGFKGAVTLCVIYFTILTLISGFVAVVSFETGVIVFLWVAVLAIASAVGAYISWFSKDFATAVSERHDLRLQQNEEGRRKLYEELGEDPPTN